MSAGSTTTVLAPQVPTSLRHQYLYLIVCITFKATFPNSFPFPCHTQPPQSVLENGTGSGVLSAEQTLHHQPGSSTVVTGGHLHGALQIRMQREKPAPEVADSQAQSKMSIGNKEAENAAVFLPKANHAEPDEHKLGSPRCHQGGGRGSNICPQL